MKYTGKKLEHFNKWYKTFQETLIGLYMLNSGFKNWKVIYSQVRLKMGDDLNEVNLFNSPDAMRLALWPRLQQDQKFKEERGLYPISKNTIGIKLTDDIDEVKEFVESEYGRAMALLKKVAVFRRDIKEHIKDTQFHNIMDMVTMDEQTQTALNEIADTIESEGDFGERVLTAKDLNPRSKYLVADNENVGDDEVIEILWNHIGKKEICFLAERGIRYDWKHHIFDKELKVIKEVKDE